MRTTFNATILVIALAICSWGQAVTGKLTATSSDCATAGSCVEVTGIVVNQMVTVQIKGTFTATASFEATVDGTTWVAVAGVPATVAGTRVLTTAAAGIWQINIAGYTKFRVRASAYTSGTATVTIRRSNYRPREGAAT